MSDPSGSNTNGPCEVWNAQWCGEQPGDDYATRASEAATEILWALSGRQFGLCTWTERPCRRTAGEWYASQWPQWGYPLWPALRDDPFWVACGAHVGDVCSCTHVSEIILPGVVHSVDEVKVDGVVLTAPSAGPPPVVGQYRVDNGNRVVRTDGLEFPLCQNMNLPDSAVGTMSIRFTTGIPVPTLGQLAAGELAQQLYNSCVGKPCSLPTRMTSITRQGVSMVLIDPQTYLDNGYVGLTICDAFIQTYNPNHLSSAPTVYSPDMPTHRGTW